MFVILNLYYPYIQFWMPNLKIITPKTFDEKINERWSVLNVDFWRHLLFQIMPIASLSIPVISKNYQLSLTDNPNNLSEESRIHSSSKKLRYTNSLVNADSFYSDLTNSTFQKIPISCLTQTMKHKFLH